MISFALLQIVRQLSGVFVELYGNLFAVFLFALEVNLLRLLRLHERRQAVYFDQHYQVLMNSRLK